MDKTVTSLRLKELRIEKGLSYKALALQLDLDYNCQISDKQLMYFEKGVEEYHSKSNAVMGMAVKTLYALARFYNVSTDYLIGLTDVKSPDTQLKGVCEYTGLNESIVTSLSDTEYSNYIAPLLNLLSESYQTEYLCKSIINYLNTEKLDIRGSDYFEFGNMDCITNAPRLNWLFYNSIDLNGEMILSQERIDNDFWENYFLLEIQKTLEKAKTEIKQDV